MSRDDFVHTDIQERRGRQAAQGTATGTRGSIHVAGGPSCLPADRLRKVTEFIDASIGERLEIPRLAAILGMSPGYFATLFKKTTGLAPHEAILRRRIALSQELLANTSLSVTEISYQLGFSSHAHFSTAFRQHVGTSPITWRGASTRRTSHGAAATDASREPLLTFVHAAVRPGAS